MDLVSHILDEEKTDDIDKPNRYKYDRIKCWLRITSLVMMNLIK